MSFLTQPEEFGVRPAEPSSAMVAQGCGRGLVPPGRTIPTAN